LKKYPKIVQCDARGQIVIPKDVRAELRIDEGSAFWMYSITDEGILLKLVPRQEFTSDSPIVAKVKEKAAVIKVNPKNIDQSVVKYNKGSGRLEEI
jgi:AbrB family looped-hinge helix DNA binding protein